MRRRRARASASRGLTIVESVISIVLVSVLLVASLNTVTVSTAMRMKTVRGSEAMLLAQDIMSEILARPYDDPDGAPDDALVGRAAFDDIFDYDGWTASPPTRHDGTIIEDLAEYTRSVEIDYANPAALGTIQNLDAGICRVRVVVARDGIEIATIDGFRTREGALAGDVSAGTTPGAFR